DGLIRDKDTGFDNHAGAYPDSFSDSRIRSNGGAWMYASIISAISQKPCSSACETQFGIPHMNSRFAWKLAGSDDYAARSAWTDIVIKLFLGITEIGWSGILQTRDRFQNDIVITVKFASDKVGNFLNGFFHVLLRRYSATACAV